MKKHIVSEEMYKKSYIDIKEIIWSKPATIVYLKTGEKGVAIVQLGDKWNKELGFWVAYAKALREQSKPMRNIYVAVEQCIKLTQKAIEYRKVKLQEKCVGIAPIGEMGPEIVIPKHVIRDGFLNLSGLK